MKVVAIMDRRSGATLAEHAGWYDSMWNSFRGLMLRRQLPSGAGIVLTPCNSVHMALMRMPLDVVYFDVEHRIVKLVSDLKPYRVSFGGRGAHAAIELPAGTLRGKDLAVGDSLEFAAVSA
jgi:uncharacterized protein